MRGRAALLWLSIVAIAAAGCDDAENEPTDDNVNGGAGGAVMGGAGGVPVGGEPVGGEPVGGMMGGAGGEPECVPVDEICDELDNDCDGASDEGGVCVVCGDGEVEGDEACDDGNVEPGDGCDADCQLEDGAVRLVDGESESQGRVEMYRDGAWGDVCDSAWGDAGANVVCRQLGYLAGEAIQDFGGGEGGHARVGVNCANRPARLIQCNPEEGACNHDNDIGVICFDGEIGSRCRNDSNSLGTRVCVDETCQAEGAAP